ncbi:hypothetical protein [Halorientalis pallida]|uniref:SpoIIAA-like n=1 Tax=Halorientalis pallida TaxID=2479928 RepID=A0A498L1I3_9EURY|nr:hypothetical protein [Halorientalis pallida]RXK51151.1 hypothetical protein EAF64_00435 [Halorientalis pallida]
MATQDRGDGWTVEVDDGVMIWEFLPGMELSAFREEAYPVFENLLERHDVVGMVTVVELDDAFDSEVFDVWEKSAQRAEEAGLERWGVVADGIKSLSLRGKVDTGGLDTTTTEDRTEAVEWARSG